MQRCTDVLQRAGVPRASAEARDLAAAVLDKPRFWSVLHPDQVLAGHEAHGLLVAARKRAAGAPFAYAVRRASFRFLTLHVDERVLIPRPETEMLVELVLASERAKHPAGAGVAADIGTGSGAIALALAAEGHFARVVAADISQDALDVARWNADTCASALRAPVEFRQGDALAPLRGELVDILVSNPPYIAFEEVKELPENVRNWEPPAALACAHDGLAMTRALVQGAASILRPRGLMALETDSRRAFRVAQMLHETESFEAIAVRRDLTGRDRFVTATRRE